MLSLILKDLLLQRRSILLGFVYMLVMIFAFSTGGSAMFTAGAFMLIYMLVQTPGAHDFKCNADAMLNSLPVNRSTIVSAKYLSVIVYVLIATAEYSALYFLIRLSGLPIRAYPPGLEGFVGLAVMVVILIAVYYPLYFKLGYMKTRYINVFLFAGLFAAGSAIVLAVKKEDSLKLIQDIGNLINSQPAALMLCGVAGVALGLVLLSYCLSIYFYKRKEF